MARSVAISGKSELVRKVNVLAAAMSGEERQGVRASIMDVLGDAADVVANAIRAAAAVRGVPAAVIGSVFTFKRLPESLRIRKSPSALAGVAKQETLREWRAGKRPRSPRAKVQPGGRVAESLATMYEFGTSKRPATGFAAAGVSDSRTSAREVIQTGLARLLWDNTQ